MEPETDADGGRIRQVLIQDFEFDTLGAATRFVGQLGDVAAEDQSLEVVLRNGRVTVRIGAAGETLSSRETAFMQRIRGLA